MAQYKIPDPEELMPCPYDKVHMIRAKRMQYHLMKCRKNYAGKDFATCPFNARHEMPRPELRYHMSNCPDKALIEPALSYESSKRNGDGTLFKGCTDVPAYENVTIPQRENWDEEIPSVARIGVDPNYYLKLSYKDMTGMTKQQKKFYKQQMALPPEERQLAVEYEAPKKEEKEEEEEKRLRLPHQAPQAYIGMYQPQQKLQQPSQVFAYSMSMAGVGRGQSIANLVNQSATQPQMNGTTVPPSTQAPVPAPMFPGRGRGRGMLPPSLMMPGGNPNTVNVTTNGHLINQDSSALTNGYMSHASGSEINGINTQPPQATVNPTPVFTMGVGRGRGSMIAAGLENSKIKPAFIVPHVNSAKLENGNQDSNESEADSNNNEDSGSNMSEQELQEDKNKTIKKIMKKLKQIEILERKKSEGERLGETEELKISKKDELTEQLEALQI